ncbi:2762_t:CDS:2, partial [Racocetra persica]
MKKVVINSRNQTEYDSDVSDTTLEDWNEEKPEEFDAYTITASMIGLFYKEQSYWSSYEISFQKIDEERKWHLSSGRNVEDILYVYMSKLEYKQLAYSFIIKFSISTKDALQSLVNSNDTPNDLSSDIIDKTLNSNDTHKQIISCNEKSNTSSYEVTTSSNSDTQQELETSISPTPVKTISLEEKEENKFLDLMYKEQIRTDKLRQELFNTSLEMSLQDYSISKNIKPEQIKISETACPKKIESMDGSAKCIVNLFDINEISQNLAQLCDTAIGAEDRALKANQEEIICWSLYGRDFEFQVESRISILPSLKNTSEVSSEDNIIEISGTACLEKILPHIEISDL